MTAGNRSFVAAALALLPLAASAQQAPLAPPVAEQLAPYASTADSVKLPDGRELHFVCMGHGAPTVILTAGLGDPAMTAWSTIQPDMARMTRVCAWDRPGFGLSDGTAAPVTVATTTADLEAALATGKIPGGPMCWSATRSARTKACCSPTGIRTRSSA